LNGVAHKHLGVVEMAKAKKKAAKKPAKKKAAKKKRK
jgi:hypothetical protein